MVTAWNRTLDPLIKETECDDFTNWAIRPAVRQLFVFLSLNTNMGIKHLDLLSFCLSVQPQVSVCVGGGGGGKGRQAASLCGFTNLIDAKTENTCNPA